MALFFIFIIGLVVGGWFVPVSIGTRHALSLQKSKTISGLPPRKIIFYLVVVVRVGVVLSFVGMLIVVGVYFYLLLFLGVTYRR